MDIKTHNLIERVAQLSAENAELRGILAYVMDDIPKEKPTAFNIAANFKHARKLWAMGQTLKIRVGWMAADKENHDGE